MEKNQRKLILVIDDDSSIGEAIASFLKETSFDVISESSPEKAVALCRHLQVDLVILDIQMPKLDGFEVLRLLREKQPYLKSIILSGHINKHGARLQLLKPDRILSKPPQTDELMRAINELSDTLVFEPEFDDKSPAPKARLLIIDNDAEYGDTVARFLQNYPNAKFEVLCSTSGIEGTEKAAFFQPDFILIDWKMPFAENHDFIRKLLQSEEWTPKQFFVISGSALPIEERRGLPIDTVYFIKPFDLEEFCDLVFKRCLDLELTE